MLKLVRQYRGGEKMRCLDIIWQIEWEREFFLSKLKISDKMLCYKSRESREKFK